MANIKKQFPEFFQSNLKESDLKSSSNNLIVLDTNFLLDIIQMPTKIARKYIETLESVKDNIYIPYLVAWEFNFRKSGIKKEKHSNIRKYRDSVKKSIEDLVSTIEGHGLITIKESKEEFSSDLINKVQDFQKEILTMLDKKVAVSITKEEDEIYEELINIIENKIGEKYDQDWIKSVETEGEKRYEDKIPPGFDDAGKDDTDDSIRRYDNLIYRRKFGDLIIWKDIIEYSKELENQGSKVIYITDDGRSNKKNDLLYKVDNLIVGPHIDMMNELQLEAGKELYILANLRFVQLVSSLTDAEIKSLSANKHTEETRDKLFEDYGLDLGKLMKELVIKEFMSQSEKSSEEELEAEIDSNNYSSYSNSQLLREYNQSLQKEIELSSRSEFQDGVSERENRIKRAKNREYVRQLEDELNHRKTIGRIGKIKSDFESTRHENSRRYSQNKRYNDLDFLDRDYDLN